MIIDNMIIVYRETFVSVCVYIVTIVTEFLKRQIPVPVQRYKLIINNKAGWTARNFPALLKNLSVKQYL